MIRHVVMFRWSESDTDEQLLAMSAALDALPGAIAEIVAYRHGRDLGVGPTNFQYAITADFANVDDFVAYRDHPEHQRFIADHITGRVAERAAVQFEYAD
ncbi:MAG TPA: Dabb family protein [Ilumatobacteraceae bacterium]|nr:Dabb family protein [Ilumatobacteraceae bacterium]